MNAELISLNTWLKSNKLSLNIAKTEFMVIGSCQRLATFENNDLFKVFVGNKGIKNVQSTISLGLTIDEYLTWKNHNKIFQKRFRPVSVLLRE